MGHVVGIAYTSTFAQPHAFYYNGTTSVDIGTLGGTTGSALSINDSEVIAGYSATADGVEHAFRYANGLMTDLGTLGGDYSYGVDINNQGVVVGGSFTDAGNSAYRAFVCPDDTLIDLNGLVDDSGIGWTLIEARAINDAGQIAGVGMFEGVRRTFLLTPLPATDAPVITGLEIDGGAILISFSTTETGVYSVEERINFDTGSWATALEEINGTGGVVTATIANAAAGVSRYFRVTLEQP
jgi:probable HAF family extracellular repeat protein